MEIYSFVLSELTQLGPKVMKLLPCSTQLSMEFYLISSKLLKSKITKTCFLAQFS